MCLSLSFTNVTSNVSVGPSISIDVLVDDLLYIRAGDPIKIPATIKGRPDPKVTWDFDGKAKSHKKNKVHTLPVDSEVRTIISSKKFCSTVLIYFNCTFNKTRQHLVGAVSSSCLSQKLQGLRKDSVSLSFCLCFRSSPLTPHLS